jgi:hypothetical protein
MKSITTKYLFLFFLLLAFSSCKKDNGVSPLEPSISQIKESKIVPLFKAYMTGSSNITISDNAPIAIRSSTEITIYATDNTNSNRQITITIPLDVYNGAGYSTANSCDISVRYSDNSSAYYADCYCAIYSCDIHIDAITQTYVKGTFSGSIVTNCSGSSGYSVNSGSSFAAQFY